MNISIKCFLRNLVRKDTILRAIKFALIVGPVLILINHYDSLIVLNFSLKFYLKSILTFFVPFSVSAISSALAYTEDELSSK
ncbi:MAG: nitrate/nitrite transporter NrtS [Thermodesulfobacteriota bacterium]